MKETLGLDKERNIHSFVDGTSGTKEKTLTDCHRRVLFFKLSVNMSLDVFKFKLNKTKHQSFDVLFVCFIFNYHKKLNNIVGA